MFASSTHRRPTYLISSLIICTYQILKKNSFGEKGSSALTWHPPHPFSSRLRKRGPEGWARLPLTVVATCAGLEKVPCRLRSPPVHVSLLERLESLSDAALTGPIIGILPCLGLHKKRLNERDATRPPSQLQLWVPLWGCHSGGGECGRAQVAGTEILVAGRASVEEADTGVASLIRKTGLLRFACGL